jgi:ATP-dependent RNA helicase RhlE
VLHAVREQGFTTPTPIQAQAMPLVLEGKDVIGSAQTGTGKTAAFGLPIISKLRESPTARPRALILEPTREMAAQVDEALRQFCEVHGPPNMRSCRWRRLWAPDAGH